MLIDECIELILRIKYLKFLIHTSSKLSRDPQCSELIGIWHTTYGIGILFYATEA